MLKRIRAGGEPPSVDDLRDRMDEAYKVNSNLPWGGLAIRLAQEIRQRCDDHANLVRHVLKNVEFDQAGHRSESGLLVDFVSGGVLYDDGKVAGSWRQHDVYEHANSGALHLLLLDEDGQPRPVAKEGWEDIDFLGEDVPFDSSEAKAYLRWVISLEPERVNEWAEDIIEDRRLTALQRMILSSLLANSTASAVATARRNS